jgi:hypothetical protein
MRIHAFSLALAFAACVDSEASDGDTTSTATADASSSGQGGTTTTSGTTLPAESSSAGPIYDVMPGEGTTYLLAFATTLDPALPLQFLAEIEVADGALSISMQPLSLDEGSTTTPRQPVGDVLVPTIDFMTPAFSAELDDAVIPGAANPISGSEISGSITLIGSLAGAGTPCGVGEGMLTAPEMTSLVGSTWAATPVTGIDDLPDDFPTACP